MSGHGGALLRPGVRDSFGAGAASAPPETPLPSAAAATSTQIHARVPSPSGMNNFLAVAWASELRSGIVSTGVTHASRPANADTLRSETRQLMCRLILLPYTKASIPFIPGASRKYFSEQCLHFWPARFVHLVGQRRWVKLQTFQQRRVKLRLDGAAADKTITTCERKNK